MNFAGDPKYIPGLFRLLKTQDDIPIVVSCEIIQFSLIDEDEPK